MLIRVIRDAGVSSSCARHVRDGGLDPPYVFWSWVMYFGRLRQHCFPARRLLPNGHKTYRMSRAHDQENHSVHISERKLDFIGSAGNPEAGGSGATLRDR